MLESLLIIDLQVNKFSGESRAQFVNPFVQCAAQPSKGKTACASSRQ